MCVRMFVEVKGQRWRPEVSLPVHQESLFLGYFVSLGRVSHWPGLLDQAKTAGQQSSSPRLELQVCVTVPGFIHKIEPNASGLKHRHFQH